MHKETKLTNRRRRGQSMTEYIIIVALISIAAIAVVTIFGNNIRGLFASSANALVGESTAPTELGGKKVTGEDVSRNLKDFHKFE